MTTPDVNATTDDVTMLTAMLDDAAALEPHELVGVAPLLTRAAAALRSQAERIRVLEAVDAEAREYVTQYGVDGSLSLASLNRLRAMFSGDAQKKEGTDVR